MSRRRVPHGSARALRRQIAVSSMRRLRRLHRTHSVQPRAECAHDCAAVRRILSYGLPRSSSTRPACRHMSSLATRCAIAHRCTSLDHPCLHARFSLSLAFASRKRRCQKKGRKTSLRFWHYLWFPGSEAMAPVDLVVQVRAYRSARALVCARDFQGKRRCRP